MNMGEGLINFLQTDEKGGIFGDIWLFHIKIHSKALLFKMWSTWIGIDKEI